MTNLSLANASFLQIKGPDQQDVLHHTSTDMEMVVLHIYQDRDHNSKTLTKILLKIYDARKYVGEEQATRHITTIILTNIRI